MVDAVAMLEVAELAVLVAQVDQQELVAQVLL